MSSGSGDSDESERERDERVESGGDAGEDTPSPRAGSGSAPPPKAPATKERPSRFAHVARVLRSSDPRTRLRFAIAGGGVAALVVAFAACGGCGRRPATTSGDGDAASKASASASGEAALHVDGADAGAGHDPLLWANAKEGDPEDLATLAAHEGAAGLVEAASEPPLRPTAIRAMAYARGWSQLPFLAKAAGGKDDSEARIALDATLDLASRPRTSEDAEDADELKEGCEGLLALARDAGRARARRVAAVRALRMMPCPKADLPADVDAK